MIFFVADNCFSDCLFLTISIYRNFKPWEIYEHFTELQGVPLSQLLWNIREAKIYINIGKVGEVKKQY